MFDAQEKGHKGIVYLAGPYSHPDPAVREGRYTVITAVAAQLISKGRIVFSPLTMTHPIDQLLAGHSETLGSDYWVNFDEAFMEFCSEIVVVMVDGWDKSSGVAREIKFFRDRGRPVHHIPCKEEVLIDF
jgi:nucleoside 2-deoxyribosyltransferase